MSFEAIFTAEAARDITEYRKIEYRAFCAAVSDVLTRSQPELVEFLRANPGKLRDAPELVAWLLHFGGKRNSGEAALMRGAAARLSIALNELGAIPSIH